MEQLPLKSVVLFIAFGTMAFIIVFIFAKRQITRYALKSRGPHIMVGYDAPKALRQEIERRLKRVSEIHIEPKLLAQDSEHYSSSPETSKFLYRMQAVDGMALLDAELLSFRPTLRRRTGGHLRAFLLDQHQVQGALHGIEVTVINRFADSYEHARHDPQEFQQAQYQEYMDLLTQLIEHIRNRKNKKREQQQQQQQQQAVSGAGKEEPVDNGAAGDGREEAEEVGEEVMPPLASPDSIDVGIPAGEDGGKAGKDDGVQVMYRPLKSDIPSTEKLHMRVGAGSGSSPSMGPDDRNCPLVDEGDEVSLCSGSNRSSSHLETQV